MNKLNLILLTVASSSILVACGGGTGGSNPTTSYYSLNYPSLESSDSTLVTGVREISGSSNVYISGFYTSNESGQQTNTGFIYAGALNFSANPITSDGIWTALNYPSSTGVTVTNTSLYGPDNGENDESYILRVVGNYTTEQTGKRTLGLLYTHNLLNDTESWQTLDPQSLETRAVKNTIAHSIMGELAVGNYDTDLGTGKAFIYNVDTESYVELTKPGAVSLTAYGIWHNQGDNYTIAGGYSDVNESGIDTAYLVDWNAATNTASHWKTYSYNNQNSFITHFEGITGDGSGGYNLVADWAQSASASGASFVHVPRNSDGTFGNASWTEYAYPNATLTSANTVCNNYALGIYQTGSGISYGYVAVVPEQ